MISQLLLIAGGFVLLILGAEGLVRGSVRIAHRLGISPLIIGLTVAAYGTSTPELVVSLKAAIMGSPAIAAGNVVGSNIFNVGVILGLTALLRPVQVQVQLIRIDTPLMIGVSLLGVALLYDGSVNRLEAGLLVVGLVAYTLFTVWFARHSSSADQAAYASADDSPALPGWGLSVLYVAAGLGLLVLGGNFLVNGATALARDLGISEAIIGLTIVAAGTSLPELATSVLAALRGHADIAIGNIVGSNLYNLLAILGLTGLVHPIAGAGMSMLDLGTMLALAALLWPIIYTSQRVQRLEGAALLAVYAGYLWFIWP